MTGDYLSKLLTQLAGGSAPDAFYAGDDQMSKLITSNNVLALDDFLASDKATVKFTDHYAGLTKWMKGEDGKIYGLPNDCNPIALWFNQDILAKAGVEDPAAQQEAGTWTLDAFTDLLTKVKSATGQYGNVRGERLVGLLDGLGHRPGRHHVRRGGQGGLRHRSQGPGDHRRG